MSASLSRIDSANPKPEISAFTAFCIRYGTTVLLVGIALGLTMFIWTFVHSFASPLFQIAIMVVAWRYGLRPGFVATILSGICIEYFFVAQLYQPSGDVDNIARLFVFALEGWAFCWLITSRTKATALINDSRDRLQALSLRQQTLREEERKRIALEIHDELGQALTGIKLETHFLSKHLSTDEDDAVRRRVTDLKDSIDSAIAAVRRISTELRPPILDDLGLVAAIEWQASKFQLQSGVTCVLNANAETIDLDTESKTAIFRIFQETLTNITRHAKANLVTVNLMKVSDKIILEVKDDGVGILFDKIDGSRSLGILGMRERARLIGGELDVFGKKGFGTTILLTAPITRTDI